MTDEGVETHEFPIADPRLDWRSEHDPASRLFGIREVTGAVDIRPRAWRAGPVLDQGREGACVGFAWTGELIASPRPDPHTDEAFGTGYALSLYYRAQQVDAWPGEDYSGTSVIAGAKVVAERGLIDEYRWCFSLDEVRAAVINEGPVVIGIPWYDGMYRTRPSGLVQVGGSLVGGHALLVTGYHPGMRIHGEDWHARFEVFRWRNSWGPTYGRDGDAMIRAEDLRDLLADHGEACVPVGRRMVRLQDG